MKGLQTLSEDHPSNPDMERLRKESSIRMAIYIAFYVGKYIYIVVTIEQIIKWNPVIREASQYSFGQVS